MDFFQIECFLELARSENFTLAAKRLYVSQSTISKKISKLEEELDIDLFFRTPSGVYLTAAGNQFLVFAENVATQRDLLEISLNALKASVSGQLQIGTIPAVSFGEISRYLSEFIKVNLSVQTTLIERDQLSICRKLQQKQLDFAFLRDFYLPADFEKYSLGEDVFVFYCHRDHPYAGRHTVPAKQLDAQPMVLLDEGSAIHGIAREFFETHDLHPEIVATNSRHEILLELVKQGYITCLPESLNLSSSDPELSFFTLDIACTSPNVLARNRNMALKPEGELFLNHMKTYTNGKPARES